MDEQKTIENVLWYVLALLGSVNHYPYHNINHTMDVYLRVWYLCEKEGIWKEDTTDLLIAALFHDTGFIVQYMNNESLGAKIARTYLESMGHSESRIQKVERCILSTILFSEARDILEGIMQDADLDNLGRKDCFTKTLLVWKELITIAHIDIPKEKWLQTSLNLLWNYTYKTTTAKKEREDQKKQNIHDLENKVYIKK